MEGIKDALLRLVKAARGAKELQESYAKVNLDDNPAFNIYADIADGIYCLIGEHTEKFEDSTTYAALTAPGLQDDIRVRILMSAYNRMHPEQPKPVIIDREKMKEQAAQGCGYMAPEGSLI